MDQNKNQNNRCCGRQIEITENRYKEIIQNITKLTKKWKLCKRLRNVKKLLRIHMWSSCKEKHGSNNYEVEDNDHY